MLSTAAFNALLKTLEEPPTHALFVLATTEVHKIPATVLSRCQRHEFRRLPAGLIADYLETQASSAGIAVDREALRLIARQATGSLRDAISLLDQLAYAGDRVSLAQAEQVLGTASAEAVRKLVQAMAAQQVGEGLAVINQALDGGADARQFARQVVQYLRDLLLVRMQAGELLQVGGESLEEMRGLGAGFAIPSLLEALRAFGQAAVSGRESWQPALRLELALVESLSPRLAAAPALPAGDPPAAAEAHSTTARPTEPARPARPRMTPGEDAASGGPATKRQDEGPPRRTPAAGSGPAEPLTFQLVLDRWDDLLGAAQARDVRIQALLADCKPLGLENRRLVLGFRDELRREKIEKKHNQATLTAALKEVFGQELGLRCVLLPDRGGRGSGALGLEEGGMVATALRDLGAQVVTVEQLPAEQAPAEDGGQADDEPERPTES
jgi:DNA polymerase-3 subunit gamma/tau